MSRSVHGSSGSVGLKSPVTHWVDRQVADRKGPISFRTITVVSSLLAAILWACSALLIRAVNGYSLFAIVGLLAVIAQVIAINSARREFEEN